MFGKFITRARRIAIFTDAFLPQINGVVTTTINLAKGLANKGHKIYIIAPKYKNLKEFEYPNVVVKRVPSIPAFFYPDFRFTFPFSKEIFNFIKKENIEVIHFQTPLTLGVQAISIAKILKIPLVGEFHTFIADHEYLKHMHIDYNVFEKIGWSYLNSYYNQCDIVACPSKSAKKEMIKNGINKKIVVISNGIDASIFSNKEYKKVKNKYNKNGKTLLFVGRIAHEKNIPFLLECFIDIKKNLPETKLLIIGD